MKVNPVLRDSHQIFNNEQTDRQKDRQTERQKDRKTDRQKRYKEEDYIPMEGVETGSSNVQNELQKQK